MSTLLEVHTHHILFSAHAKITGALDELLLHHLLLLQLFLPPLFLSLFIYVSVFTTSFFLFQKIPSNNNDNTSTAFTAFR